MLNEFSAATGITYPNVLRRVQSGEIPAVDVSSAGSTRCQWRIYEDQAAEWFSSRLSRSAAAKPSESLPDFYSADGQWIPPEIDAGIVIEWRCDSDGTRWLKRDLRGVQ